MVLGLIILLPGIYSCDFGNQQSADKTKTRALVVVEKGSGSVGFYSEDGIRIKTVKIGTYPHEMVFSADRKRAFVTNNGSLRYLDEVEGGQTVSVIDLEKMEVIDEISLAPYRRPHGISLDLESGIMAVSVENPDKVLFP